MNLFTTILIYGLLDTLVVSALVLGMIWYNPRLMLQDYPKDVQQKVPPKTPEEKRLSAYGGGAFLLLAIAFPVAAAFTTKAAHGDFLAIFLSAWGVTFLFNLVDWLILDWLIVCTITPKFMVIPGTEGMAGYKDYAMHFRGFLIGTGLLSVISLVIAVIVMWV